MAERRFRIRKNQDQIGIRPEKDEPRPRTRVNDESAIEAVYRFGDVLGKGTFGVVREVTHLINGNHFAMKIVHKDKVRKCNVTFSPQGTPSLLFLTCLLSCIYKL